MSSKRSRAHHMDAWVGHHRTPANATPLAVGMVIAVAISERSVQNWRVLAAIDGNWFKSDNWQRNAVTPHRKSIIREASASIYVLCYHCVLVDGLSCVYSMVFFDTYLCFLWSRCTFVISL